MINIFKKIIQTLSKISLRMLPISTLSYAQPDYYHFVLCLAFHCICMHQAMESQELIDVLHHFDISGTRYRQCLSLVSLAKPSQ
jgi:hypothetical protein